MRERVLAAVFVLLAVAGCGSEDRGAESTARSTVSAPPESTITSKKAQPCPSDAEVSGRADAKPRTVAVTASEQLAPDLRLGPPPPDARPRITAEQAYRRAHENFAADPGPDPTIALGLYSDDGYSHLNPDGSQTRLVQDRLAWVTVLREALVVGAKGPGFPAGSTPPSRPPCAVGTTIIPVDAQTGEVFNIHQAGGDPQ